MQPNIHFAQAAIMTDLRKSESLKYSQLSKNSPLAADVFKFHMKTLREKKLIFKNSIDAYELTVAGKEMANKIDQGSSAIKKTPKLSMLLVIRNANDTNKILLQRRLRHPFYNYWGLLSGPVPWGVRVQKAAKDELLKQTGYDVRPNIIGALRELNKIDDQELITEDKVFMIMEANVNPTESQPSWPGGENKWVDIDELATLNPVFSNTYSILNSPTSQISWFNESFVTYRSEDY